MLPTVVQTVVVEVPLESLDVVMVIPLPTVTVVDPAIALLTADKQKQQLATNVLIFNPMEMRGHFRSTT